MRFDKNIAGAFEWSASPCVSLFVTIVGRLLNLWVLSNFLWRPSLHNPFAIYIINVVVVDLTLDLAHGPLNVTERFCPSLYLGLPICVFFLYIIYLSYTFQSLISFAHFLISLNCVSVCDLSIFVSHSSNDQFRRCPAHLCLARHP